MSKGGSGIGFLLVVGAMIGGGYMDIQNNDDTKPSTEGSNPTVVAEYQTQIKDLTELKSSGANYEDQSVDFLTSVYVNTQISEADVKALTDEFTTKVAPPATLKGGYVLEHPEYLDEARAETSSRNLGALDQATMAKYQEAMDDGPWLGVLAGWAAAEIGLPLITILLLGGAGAVGGIGNAASRSVSNWRARRKRSKMKYGGH